MATTEDVDEGREAEPDDDSASLTRAIRRAAPHVPAALAALALVHPAARAGARLAWWMDLFTHFYVAAFWASAAAVVGLALRRRPALALAFAALAGFQAVPLLRYAGPSPVPPAPPPAARLRVLMANLHVENDHYAAIAALIRRERPDVVGFVEVLPHLLAGLESTGVDREYPYRYILPVGAQGQALWFRRRPEAVDEPAILVPDGNPAFRATVLLDGLPVRLWLVHPPNPIGPGHRRADPDLKALGLAVGAEDGPRLVVGDLNRTEGSPHFADFLADSGLRDSRLGFGRQPSWPAGSPYRIAIDHAFLSAGLAVVDRRLGPSIGSDHLPLILDFAASATAPPAPVPTSPTKSEAQPSRSSGGPAPSAENLARSAARR